jgi:hypothetical protein
MEKETIQSELDQPMWAVVSFDRVLARDLNREQADATLSAYSTTTRESGLIVITAEAAARYGGQ